MASLLLEIITPDGVALRQETASVKFPTAMGELTILPSHQPIMGQTQTGELTYLADSQKHTYAIDNGFFMLEGDKLALLVEGAVDTAKIDLTAISSAQKRAEEALKNAEKMDAAEREEFERVVRFSMAQRLIKQK